MVVVILTPYQA